MKYFVGIDLGTTNSAICSFDGEEVTLYKDPEQHDVTPSAILIDRRGNKYVGKRAYDGAALNPGNAVTKFKRYMGTSTPMRLEALNITLTPEQCSAEILRVLFGYLPDHIRNSPETGTIITVPAAFNQMQKEATLAAANDAGIGLIGMMQEPVAAVMSVMRKRKGDGTFIIYDLGGGTLDIAIAQSTLGRVSLVAHGGIAMCGGADFDRIIFDRIVKPWLLTHFRLPDAFDAAPAYQPMVRIAKWVAEKAKIGLSARPSVQISDPAFEDRHFRDEAGQEIYLDVPLSSSEFDALVAEEVDNSVACARETIKKAGLSPSDIARVVFVGGPTQYKPLRDRVSTELGIPASTDVNPMTAVAEGAALFAEAIDWTSQTRGRKSSRGSLATGGPLNVALNYIARTPANSAKIAVNLGGRPLPGASFQIDSIDTGWTSGRLPLTEGTSLDLPLSKNGDNAFKLFVLDPNGRPISVANDRIVITRTAATIEAIPSSSTIFIEALSRIDGVPEPVHLVKEGDPLPAKGKQPFRSNVAVRAGTRDFIRFRLREGDIPSPLDHNTYIGDLEIFGTDFDYGSINVGDELQCAYQVLDSGQIIIEVTVPSIRGTFQKRNFYARRRGPDFTAATELLTAEADAVRQRIEDMSAKVSDPKLDTALEKLERAENLSDPETAKRTEQSIIEAKALFAQARKERLTEMRQVELDHWVTSFREHVQQFAAPAEVTAFENLARTAQRAIDAKSQDFDIHIRELHAKTFAILWKQDWFIVDRFKMLAQRPWLFGDTARHAELVARGVAALKGDNIPALRDLVIELETVKIDGVTADDPLAAVTIVKG
jgi:molecular chaperone DnaK